jgi:uncharacterized membrane protein YkoI
MTFRSLLLAAALIAGFAPMADARPPFGPHWATPQDQGRPQQRGPERRVLPLREVVNMVRDQRGGQLIDVLSVQDDGPRPVYVLRWRMDDGRVADLRVDATTGRIIGGG